MAVSNCISQNDIKFSSASKLPPEKAKNAAPIPIETVAQVKSQQLKVKNPNMGVDCKETGTNDMKEQGVFETLIGKQQQMLLATQVVKLILKIDDVITSGKYD